MKKTILYFKVCIVIGSLFLAKASFASRPSASDEPDLIAHCQRLLGQNFNVNNPQVRIIKKGKNELRFLKVASHSRQAIYNVSTNNIDFATEQLNREFNYIGNSFRHLIKDALQLNARMHGTLSIYTGEFLDGPKVRIIIDFPTPGAKLVRLPVDLRKTNLAEDHIFDGYEIRISHNRVDVFRIQTYGILVGRHYVLSEQPSHGINFSFYLQHDREGTVSLFTGAYRFDRSIFVARSRLGVAMLLNFTKSLAASIFPASRFSFSAAGDEFVYSDKTSTWRLMRASPSTVY